MESHYRSDTRTPCWFTARAGVEIAFSGRRGTARKVDHGAHSPRICDELRYRTRFWLLDAFAAGKLSLLAKEQFFYPATQPLFKQLEQLSQRSSVSRGQAFEDFLTAVVCALAAETKEDEYLAMIERHKEGKPGRRGADLMPIMFAELVNAMDDDNRDILGDLFQGSITYGEAGQYFTPESVSRLMAELSVDPDRRPADGQTLYINDPTCGTGRMLLEASNINPQAELVGQDIDARCARITAVNLGLRSRYGYVVCGNTLSGETQFAYRIAPFFHESPNGRRRGVIRDIPPELTPVPVIESRLRSDAQSLFEQPPQETELSAVTLPTIMEIPHWLSRLEPKLAALDSKDTSDGPVEQRDKPTTRQDDEPPPQQKSLF